MKRKILVVEDEKAIRKFVRINLEREDYLVFEAESGEEGLKIARSENIDLVVLDLMLPNMNGYEVCKQLREDYEDLGIIMLTAKSQDMDKIVGLENGADDYMTKPFNPKELVLRVESLIRRLPKRESEGILEFGPFKLKDYSKSFYKNEEIISLTPTEYKIMELFMKNPGKAFTRDDLLDLIWNYDFLGDTKIIDVNMRRLRTKIEEDSKKPKYIETVWGVGYRWRKEEV